jgi:hypothetical protein
MPQITTITSEALQATIRRLLPSQRGFGQDLEATNLITPIIDLTPTAEGSQLPTDLARAACFGTEFEATGASADVTISASPGFYRVLGSSTLIGDNTNVKRNLIFINDGSSDTNVWAHKVDTGGINNEVTALNIDLVIFVRTGDTLKANNSNEGTISGSVRQVADVYGNITNPVGFTFE